jgi:endoglucanase
VSDLLSYMKELATVMSDTSPRCGRVHGWYCNFVRVNTDSVGGWSSAEGLIDSEQFDAWIANFLVPYANHLWTRGIYLVLCATGPVVVNVDGDMSKNASQGTQERLLTFWERVASAPGVKNADNIMFELMNEPVKIESAPGNGVWGMGSAVYFKAFAEWLKPIIDVIRGTGANNIIWVPTLEW